ncbi:MULTISPECIES: hypothetical protein [Pandoraea]|uniref:Uncharacterized protein n=2 Tax=Pandoraea TaxID=93217 RepID=A0A5E4XKI5_9BURK|nr:MULTISPECIES: hypothetical protein [Pandoraea]VVE18735.1 hypothetical protein PCE31107_03036 [Pandoraea cepalis]VVE36648.1 hypothetical protein PTE31013_03959 [Pandoraea terrigena]
MSAMAPIHSADPIPTMPDGLSHEAQQELSALAVSLRVHFNGLLQTAVQIALITYRLSQIIGDSVKAQAYFCQVTGKAPSTFRNYRGIGRIVSKHFTHPEGYIPMHITRLPLETFQLLDDDIDARVVDAIAEHAQNGPLTVPQVKKLIAEATADLRGDLDEANARVVELAASAAEAQAHAKDAEIGEASAKAKHDSVVVQLRAQEQLATELQADRSAILNDLREAQEDINRLRQAESQIQYVDKTVEVLPPDVESLEQARTELAEVSARKARLTQELQDLESMIADARESSKSIDELENGVGGLIAAFPSALVLKMRGSNPMIGTKIDAIAGQLRALADTLASKKIA